MSAALVLSGERRWTVDAGDCLELLRALPDACVDAICADPPAGISFMGRAWDANKGGRDKWIPWLAERMAEALRVLKPGGHGLVWALPRTSHWTGMALEDAGFEVRDRISHLFGSGFPKSLNVGKGIDKLAGAQREDLGRNPNVSERQGIGDGYGGRSGTTRLTAPATEEAQRWDGWGTALKPAAEDWWLVRKPPESSIVRNVLEHGTGAINIDGCRVPHASADDHAEHAAGVAAIKARGGSMDHSWKNSSDLAGASDVSPGGRWPSHVLLSHADGCERIGTRKVKAAPSWNDNRSPSLFTGETTSPVHHTDGDGFETVDAWDCVEGCPVRMLDEQSGDCPAGHFPAQRTPNEIYGNGRGTNLTQSGGPRSLTDEGGASRYFTQFAPFIYEAKCDRADRERGCEYLPATVIDPQHPHGSIGAANPRAGAGRTGKRKNHHPTVKSTDLMRWLVRLITPPNGIVLDPFAGSGSTGVACSAERLRFIGFELSDEYAEIARARILGDCPLLNVGGL